MKSFAIISIFAIAIKAVAANDCEMLLNQFNETENACHDVCYSWQREGLVQIVEVSSHFLDFTLRVGHSTSTNEEMLVGHHVWEAHI